MRWVIFLFISVVCGLYISSCGKVKSGNNEVGDQHNNYDKGNGDEYLSEDVRDYILSSAVNRAVVVALNERINLYMISSENTQNKTYSESIIVDVLEHVIALRKNNIVVNGTIIRSCGYEGLVIITTDDTTGKFSIEYDQCRQAVYMPEYICTLTGNYDTDDAGNVTSVSMSIKQGCTIEYLDGEKLQFQGNLDFNVYINMIKEDCPSGLGMDASFNVSGGPVRFTKLSSSDYADIEYYDLNINIDASCKHNDKYEYNFDGTIYYYDNYCIDQPTKVKLDIYTPNPISYTSDGTGYSNCDGSIDINGGDIAVYITDDCKAILKRNGVQFYLGDYEEFLYIAGMCSID